MRQPPYFVFLGGLLVHFSAQQGPQATTSLSDLWLPGGPQTFFKKFDKKPQEMSHDISVPPGAGIASPRKEAAQKTEHKGSCPSGKSEQTLFNGGTHLHGSEPENIQGRRFG